MDVSLVHDKEGFPKRNLCQHLFRTEVSLSPALQQTAATITTLNNAQTIY